MTALINFVAQSSDDLHGIPIGTPGVDRDGMAVVRDWHGVQLFVAEQKGWAHISFEELDGAYTEDGVSQFFPITFGGPPAKL